MTINETISDAELSDLRHRYRNDVEVSRIIACLTATREELDEAMEDDDEDEDECEYCGETDCFGECQDDEEDDEDDEDEEDSDD